MSGKVTQPCLCTLFHYSNSHADWDCTDLLTRSQTLQEEVLEDEGWALWKTAECWETLAVLAAPNCFPLRTCADRLNHEMSFSSALRQTKPALSQNMLFLFIYLIFFICSKGKIKFKPKQVFCFTWANLPLNTGRFSKISHINLDTSLKFVCLP